MSYHDFSRLTPFPLEQQKYGPLNLIKSLAERVLLIYSISRPSQSEYEQLAQSLILHCQKYLPGESQYVLAWRLASQQDHYFGEGDLREGGTWKTEWKRENDIILKAMDNNPKIISHIQKSAESGFQLSILILIDYELRKNQISEHFLEKIHKMLDLSMNKPSAIQYLDEALIHYFGLGVPTDRMLGKSFLNKAAELGSNEAIDIIENFFKFGDRKSSLSTYQSLFLGLFFFKYEKNASKELDQFINIFATMIELGLLKSAKAYHHLFPEPKLRSLSEIMSEKQESLSPSQSLDRLDLLRMNFAENFIIDVRDYPKSDIFVLFYSLFKLFEEPSYERSFLLFLASTFDNNLSLLLVTCLNSPDEKEIFHSLNWFKNNLKNNPDGLIVNDFLISSPYLKLEFEKFIDCYNHYLLYSDNRRAPLNENDLEKLSHLTEGINEKTYQLLFYDLFFSDVNFIEFNQKQKQL